MTWRLYQSQQSVNRRLGDYATASKLLDAHRTLNGTRWFRKTFEKAFSLFESYLKTIRSYLNEYDKTQYLSTPTYRRNQTVGKGGSGSAFSSFFGVYHLLRLQCRNIRQQ
nr:MAG TPA: hypothetical protein [Caudoviricetes sp.]